MDRSEIEIPETSKNRFGIKTFSQLREEGVNCLSRGVYGLENIYVDSSEDPRASQDLSDFVSMEGYSNVAEYLNLRFMPSPKTLIQGVRKLLPGEKIDLSTGETTYSSDVKIDELNWEGFKWSIDRSVGWNQNMGIFLSGGIDSSLILKLVADANYKLRGNNSNLVAYTLDNSNGDSRDARLARMLADQEGIQHRTVTQNNEDCYEFYRVKFNGMGEPICDPAIIGVNKILDQAKEDRRDVMFSGEGSDEVFLGFGRYRRCNESGSIDEAVATLPQFPELGRETLSRFQGDSPEDVYKRILEFDRSISLRDNVTKKANDSRIKTIFPFLAFQGYSGMDFSQYPKKQLKSFARGIIPDEIIDRKKTQRESTLEQRHGYELPLKEVHTLKFQEHFSPLFENSEIQFPQVIGNEYIEGLFNNVTLENARKLWSIYSLLEWEASRK